jgi:hypothetical protein
MLCCVVLSLFVISLLKDTSDSKFYNWILCILETGRYTALRMPSFMCTL